MPGDRAMPAMSSGMEAEEESEHHLQRAIATETVPFYFGLFTTFVIFRV